MEYKQIGQILNNVFEDVIGETEQTVAEDLSNIVEVGHTITSSTVWGNQYENYVKKLIDRVGKVIFRQNDLNLMHLPIFKDSWEFGSIAEKIRVEAPPTKEDQTFELWDIASYDPSDIFTPVLPEVSAKFFNNSTTFSIKITIPKRQLKSAFTSASEMSRFISLIENSIQQKLAIDLLSLEYRTEANLIAEKFLSGNNHSLVNLLYEWLRDVPNAANIYSGYSKPEDVLTDPFFLRYANMRIGMYRDFIKKPSVLYADGGYINTTSDKQQTLLLLTDFDKALDTWLYSMNRHNDFVELDGYTSVPYWMSGGETDDYSKRSTINVIPASQGHRTATPDPRIVVNMSNILGVLHDERASAITCEHKDVESINVPNNRSINYWYFADANYINDTDENVVVFYLSDTYAIGSFSDTYDDQGTLIESAEQAFKRVTGHDWSGYETKTYQFVGGNTPYTAYSASDPFPADTPLYFNIADM